jgi:hypothetical protein
MNIIKLFITFLSIGFLKANCQEITAISTQAFSDELKKLVTLNSSIPNLIDLSSKEAINITTNASARQIMEITHPYLTSTITNAKTLCLDLLNVALFKKAEKEIEKQQIVEILCKNYLNTDYEIQIVDNSLLRLSEKDFNPASKKYITALIKSEPKFDYAICAKLVAIAQIKESIPTLWKIANKKIETMTRSDVDILASLARLNEKQAGSLLCDYYNSTKNRTDYRYIIISTNLAFSLDSAVLDCLIKDFKTLDIKTSFRDGDSFYYPAGHLGANIAAMLKNYPYAKQEFQVDTNQLLNWLQETSQFELNHK